MKKSIMKGLACCFAVVLAVSCLHTSIMRTAKANEKAKTEATGFVQAEGTKFMVDGHPFYFAGCNSYDLFTLGDGYNNTTTDLILSKFMNQEKIEERFKLMAKNGVTVCRTWGFSSEEWHGFETAPGEYQEAQFMLFDYIMYCAEKYHIKMIITLENYWEAYGGIDEKLKWAGLNSGDHKSRTAWFTNEKCQTWYQNYIEHFVDRVNYFTGEAYKEDPDIFAWDLMNEPRYQDYSEEENASGKTLRKWVDTSAAYLKSLDKNHMVCAGIEGHQAKYGFGGNEGNPFVYLQQSPYIDFCSAHPYPSEGWAGLSPEDNANVVRAWIKDAHEEVGKPFVIGEFNAHNTLSYEKYEAYWRSVYDTIYEEDAAGALFWEFNTTRLSPFTVMDGDKILGYFMEMSKKMQAKSTGTVSTDKPIETAEPTATVTSGPIETTIPTDEPICPCAIIPEVKVSTEIGNTISQKYTITCSDPSYSIDLSKVSVRYYYDKVGTKEQSFSCDSAAITLNCAPYYIDCVKDVNGEFKDNYLEITFDKKFQLSSESFTMMTRFYQNDWSTYEEFKPVKMEVRYEGMLMDVEYLK